MEQQGFLKLYRKLQDNPLWHDKPFSRGQAWIDILFMAQLKESSFMKRGTKVTVQRGQIGRSMKGLSDRWGWSIGKTRRFLSYLENENQIEHQISNVTTLITVLNYDEYNQMETKTERKRKPNGNQTETYKEVKKEQELPDFIDRQLWDDFIAGRVALKKPPTDRAIVGLINKLTKLHNEGSDIDNVLNESIINGWSGVFAEKNKKQPVQNNGKYGYM